MVSQRGIATSVISVPLGVVRSRSHSRRPGPRSDRSKVANLDDGCAKPAQTISTSAAAAGRGSCGSQRRTPAAPTHLRRHAYSRTRPVAERTGSSWQPRPRPIPCPRPDGVLLAALASGASNRPWAESQHGEGDDDRRPVPRWAWFPKNGRYRIPYRRHPRKLRHRVAKGPRPMRVRPSRRYSRLMPRRCPWPATRAANGISLLGRPGRSAVPAPPCLPGDSLLGTPPAACPSRYV